MRQIVRWIFALLAALVGFVVGFAAFLVAAPGPLADAWFWPVGVGLGGAALGFLATITRRDS